MADHHVVLCTRALVSCVVVSLENPHFVTAYASPQHTLHSRTMKLRVWRATLPVPACIEPPAQAQH